MSSSKPEMPKRHQVSWYPHHDGTHFRVWKAVVFIIAFAVTSPQYSHAQGLLGKRYLEGGFQMESFDDGFIDDWVYGLSLNANRPLTETWDFNAGITAGWLNADGFVGTTPVVYDFDMTVFRAGIIKHFRPEATIDPFAGIGFRYSRVTQEASSPTVTLFRNDDVTAVDFSAGVEWKLSDRSAIRPRVVGGDTLEDFDLEESVSSNLYFECPAIFWWNENWFSTVTFATDFDDSEYGVRLTLGFGEW